MNEIVKFTSEQFGEIRTVVIDGEPWFVGNDICDVFGETNRNRAMQALDDEEKGYTQIATPGGLQKMAVVNEPGMYHLLFIMQPEKARGVSDEYVKERIDKLQRFKKWVTHEVLPSIRKTGGYIVGQDSLSEDALIEKALQVVARRMEERERQMKQLEAEKAQVEAKVVELQPKADYFDDLVERELLTNFRDTAKEFGLKQKQFIQMLESHGYLYRTPTVKDKKGKKKKGQLKPVQRYVDDGLFEIKDIKGAYSYYAGNQTLITPKGKSVFQKLIPIWMKGE